MRKLKNKVRRLAAVLFADIEGYTAIMHGNEALAAQIRSKHREAFEAQHSIHRGEIIQYYGDGALSVFASAIDAVNCAIAMQRIFNSENPRIPVRMGIHMGDIVYDHSEIYGDGVNTAARIESMGLAGSILISAKLNGELSNQLDISTKSLGQFQLKNIAEPLEIFAISNEGIRVPLVSELPIRRKKESKSVAVLPFTNLSPDPDNEYLCDGMTEEIINALVSIKGLRVTSRTSSFYFKDKKLSSREIGDQLHVSAILQGSIRVAGNRMRISIQLIDVKDDYNFWTETFDRSLDDIFATQDEISLLVAERLREHLGHFNLAAGLLDMPDIPVVAYRDYLRSRYLILKMESQSLDKGMAILSDVLNGNPHFALAHIGMHLAFTLKGTLGLMPSSEAFVKGKPHLDNAIKLKPDLPECQLNLSYIAFLQEWDLPKAYGHLRKALEIRPSVEYYQSMASILVAEHKFKAASTHIDTAVKLDPFSDITHHLSGFIQYAQGYYKQAMKSFDESLVLKPGAQAPVMYKGQALILDGQAEAALNYYQGLPDISDEMIRVGGRTLAHSALGNLTEAETGIDFLRAALSTDKVDQATNLLIACYTSMGRYQQALELIAVAITQRLPLMVYASVEPMLAPLRPYPEFGQLMEHVLRQTEASIDEDRKYKHSLLALEELRLLKSKVERFMAKDKPYLDQSLTLRQLAAMVDIAPNQLSQVLNEGLNQNFSEFINSYRLECFKELVVRPSSRHLTLLALAYECGFSSKTVFNTYFKKRIGMTPRAYVKSVAENRF